MATIAIENETSNVPDKPVTNNEFPTDYIKDRLLPQIKQYEKTGKKLQAEYYIISTLNTIVLASVPLLTMLSDLYPFLKFFVAGSSAIASIFSGILLLRRSKDNWLEYRATSEALQSELARFFAEHPEFADCYAKGIPCTQVLRNRDNMREMRDLVGACEKIIQVEREGWYNRMKAESDQKGLKKPESDTQN